MQNAKTDENQAAIVAALRAIGCRVQTLHQVGQGVPDLLVGYRGTNLLLEVKTLTGKLNPLQTAWHTQWPGQVIIVHTPAEAIQFVDGQSPTTPKWQVPNTKLLINKLREHTKPTP